MKGKECATKGLQFVTDTYNNITNELLEESIGQQQQLQLADLWALSAAVKIVRVCRGYIIKQNDEQSRQTKESSQEGEGMSNDSGKSRSRSQSVPVMRTVLEEGVVNRTGKRETKSMLLLQRESILPLCDLLQLALTRLKSLSFSLSLASSNILSFTGHHIQTGKDKKQEKDIHAHAYRQQALLLAMSHLYGREVCSSTNYQAIGISKQTKPLEQTQRHAVASVAVPPNAIEENTVVKAAVRGEEVVKVMEEVLMSDLDKVRSRVAATTNMCTSIN